MLLASRALLSEWDKEKKKVSMVLVNLDIQIVLNKLIFANYIFLMVLLRRFTHK
jgi:hypothetical protein